MRLLLDTHALLWALAGSRKLRAEARRAIVDPDSTVVVSVATVWEIAIKRSLRRLKAPDDLPERLTEAHFDVLDVAIEHALAVERLPLHHRDPFDRLLVAQAAIEGLTIVTHDAAFARYGVPVLAA